VVMHGTGGFAGGMTLGWLVWLVFIALLVWTVKSVLDSQRQSRISLFDPHEEDAIDMLEERLTNHETDDHELRRRKRMLE